MTSSINFLGPDVSRYIIDRFVHPEDLKKWQLVNKEFHKTVSDRVEAIITEWKKDPSFRFPEEMNGLSRTRQIESLYNLSGVIHYPDLSKGDAVINVPKAMNTPEYQLIQFFQFLQESAPQIEWPVLQGDNPIIKAEMIRAWMEVEENQDILNQIIEGDFIV